MYERSWNDCLSVFNWFLFLIESGQYHTAWYVYLHTIIVYLEQLSWQIISSSLNTSSLRSVDAMILDNRIRNLSEKSYPV